MIVLRAKNVEFEVTYIDLRNKPDWFLKISPHGKVPVLTVDGEPLFESNAIAEYLDETVPPRLHPEDPVRRARHRAWNDFVPDFSRGLGGVTGAKDERSMMEGFEVAEQRVERLEEAIRVERGSKGPYFSGSSLCLVDASYAPFLMRFDLVENIIHSGLLDKFPLVKGWCKALVAHEAVANSVAPEFEDRYMEMLRRRKGLAGQLLEQEDAVSAE